MEVIILKTAAISGILLILITGCFSCSQIIGTNNNVFDGVYNDPVAFIAHFLTEDMHSSSLDSHLILSDLNNPVGYKLVLDKSIAYYNPKFSRDRTKIIGGGINLSIYDIQEDIVERLYYRTDTDEFIQLEGYSIVWNYDDSGFYFSPSEPREYLSPCIFFYKFSDRTVEQVYSGPLTSIVPLELLDKNTLLVYSYDQSNIDFPQGFYKMDISSKELSLINNSYLQNMIDRDWKNILFLDAFDWNEELKLLVCSERHLGSNIISVTNLDGTYYKKYTTGKEFLAYSPVWGADGKTIIFATHPNSTGDKEEIWIIDVETGGMRAFMKEDDVKNPFGRKAISLKTPDF